MQEQDDSRAEPLNILFAGGCHVEGYPIGEEHSFPRVVEQDVTRAGIPIHVGTLSYLRLPHRRRLVAKCREARPNVLVLQLGHCELNRRLSTHLRSMCGLSSRSVSSEDSVISAVLLANPAKFYLGAGLKRIIDTCLFHPLVDSNELATRYERLLEDVDRCGIPTVILLSPLPCADSTAMYYRRRALPLFRRLALEHKCGFIDLLSLAPGGREKHFGTGERYYDAIHLGAVGQRAVGREISSYLLKGAGKPIAHQEASPAR